MTLLGFLRIDSQYVFHLIILLFFLGRLFLPFCWLNGWMGWLAGWEIGGPPATLLQLLKINKCCCNLLCACCMSPPKLLFVIVVRGPKVRNQRSWGPSQLVRLAAAAAAR